MELRKLALRMLAEQGVDYVIVRLGVVSCPSFEASSLSFRFQDLSWGRPEGEAAR